MQADSNTVLGDVKISVQVLYRPLDTVLVYNINHLSDKEALQEIKKLIVQQKE